MKNEISNHRYNKSIFLQNLVTRGESDNSMHEDILVSSDEIINDVMGKSIDILIANNLPLTKILCKFLEKEKIVFIYDKKLAHSHVRFCNKGNKVYVNVYEYTKPSKGEVTLRYDFDTRVLYMLLLQAYATLNIEVITRSRDRFKDIIFVYNELIKKGLGRIKGFKLSTESDRKKLDYILTYFIIKRMDVASAVTNADGFAKKQSDINEDVLKMLKVKHEDIRNDKKLSNTKLWEILQIEYTFLKDISLSTFEVNLVYLYSAYNSFILEDISITVCIILDYFFHNKATLNISKHSFIKDAIKPKMSNDIVHHLIEKVKE